MSEEVKLRALPAPCDSGLEERTATAGAGTSEEDGTETIRIAMIGNVDSGKSTLTGCLTRNLTDDGRGAARRMVG